MKRNLVPILMLVLLTAGFVGLVIGDAGQLPDRVAVHFNASGQANGWASREQAVQFFERLTIVPAIFFILAMIIRVLPTTLVNVPHRDYWLAPEHRAETMAAITGNFLWMGCLLVIFLAGIYRLTIEANHLAPPHLPLNWILPLAIGYVAVTIVWLGLFLRRFWKVPAQTVAVA